MPLLTLLAWGVDQSVNLGFHFGYHGELNKVVDAFDAMPEVDEVKVVGYNSDVTLEEMCIGIETKQGQALEIWFGQNDPIRKLSNRPLADALARRMAEEIRISEQGAAPKR